MGAERTAFWTQRKVFHKCQLTARNLWTLGSQTRTQSNAPARSLLPPDPSAPARSTAAQEKEARLLSLSVGTGWPLPSHRHPNSTIKLQTYSEDPPRIKYLSTEPGQGPKGATKRRRPEKGSQPLRRAPSLEIQDPVPAAPQDSHSGAAPGALGWRGPPCCGREQGSREAGTHACFWPSHLPTGPACT